MPYSYLYIYVHNRPSMKNDLLLLFISLFIGSCDIGQAGKEKIPPRPNILLILTDDMGYGDVTNSGNPYLKTPALDQLAEQSLRFKRFYVSPVCAPTRASLLTGRYHQRTGVRSVTNGFETMRTEETTIAEILQQHGYSTGLFGKWHLGEYYPYHPNAQGFDEFVGFRTGHTAVYQDATLEYNGRPKATKGYIADVLTEEALNFIETTPANQPFFCLLAINTPHTPLIIDSSWVQPYWKMGLEDRVARIYGMVANIDQNIGKIEDRLRDAQLLENTIIIFLSDNGPINGWRVPQEQMRYNAELRDQKFTTFEGGIRTQCYWRWDGHWQPREIDSGLGAHIDILPTLLNTVDIPVPDSLRIDGTDLQPLISGSSEPRPNRIFFQNYSLQTLQEPAPFPGGVAITDDGWKMVNGEELYYLPVDSSEEFNRAQVRPEYFADLKEAYLKWWETIREDCSADLLPVPVGFAAENPVMIQPHHGKAKGNLEFRGKRGLQGERTGTHPSGVDGDWLGNWKKEGDQASWNIEIAKAGSYEISLLLRGVNADQPTTIKLSVGPQEKISQENKRRILKKIISIFFFFIQKNKHDLLLIKLAETDDYWKLKALVKPVPIPESSEQFLAEMVPPKVHETFTFAAYGGYMGDKSMKGILRGLRDWKVLSKQEIFECSYIMAENDTDSANVFTKLNQNAVNDHYLLLYGMGPDYYSEEGDSGAPAHANYKDSEPAKPKPMPFGIHVAAVTPTYGLPACGTLLQLRTFRSWILRMLQEAN